MQTFNIETERENILKKNEEKNNKKFSIKTKKMLIFVISAGLVLLLLLIFAIIGISKFISNEEPYGNIDNYGMVLKCDNEVFYNQYPNGIAKESKNETFIISDDDAYGLTIIDDTIYYMTLRNEMTMDIKSIKTNGSNSKIITSIQTNHRKFYIKDNIIYYSTALNSGYGIKKLDLRDENKNEAIMVSANISDFVLYKNDMYYVDNVGYLRKINLDTNEITDVTKEYDMQKIQIYKNKIYFYNLKEDALCRMNLKGNNCKVISDLVKNNTFNVTSKYIYFYDEEKSTISRMTFDGRGLLDIVKVENSDTKINIANGNLYYMELYEGNESEYRMFRVKTNGKEAKPIKYK